MVRATLMVMMIMINGNTDREEEDGYYDRSQDEEPVSNDMLGEYDQKQISNSDNESVRSLPQY